MSALASLLWGAGLMAVGWAFGFVMGWYASDRYKPFEWFLPPSMRDNQ